MSRASRQESDYDEIDRQILYLVNPPPNVRVVRKEGEVMEVCQSLILEVTFVEEKTCLIEGR